MLTIWGVMVVVGILREKRSWFVRLAVWAEIQDRHDFKQ
jgi:hypothetical protein